LAGLGEHHQSPANCLEDLGLAKFRDEQAENAAANGGVIGNISTGADAAVNEVKGLQFLDGFEDGHAGGTEATDELGFAGQPTARLVAVGEDLFVELLKDDAIFWIVHRRPGESTLESCGLLESGSEEKNTIDNFAESVCKFAEVAG